MRKKYDVQCNNCKTKYVYSELKEQGNTEEIDDYLVIFCEKCGTETFICSSKGYKSHKVVI